MASIQQVPRGLLKLLGLKTLGQNPREFPDAVAGVVALEPYFIAGRAEFVSTDNTLVNTAGNSASLTVPSGQNWRLLSYGVRVHTPSAAGTIMFGGVGIGPSQTGVPLPVTATTPRIVATNGNEIIPAGHVLPYPMVLSPGQRIAALLLEDTGGATTVTVSAHALIVRI